MVGPSFMDEIHCGNFFDHIDDLLDFPEDDNGNGELVGGNDSFPAIWSDTGADMLLGSDDVFWGKNSGSAADLSSEISVPYEDIVQLEWLSNFVEDSFSGGSTGVEKGHSSMTKDTSHNNNFRTSSPVSVLESSSSCFGGKTMPISPKTLASSRRGRPRSKRPRPATFNLRPSMQLISPTTSFTDTPRPFLSPKYDSFGDSRPLMKIPKPRTSEYKKKKKMKLSSPSFDNGETNQNFQTPQAAVRKCMHCEITKTPQWRAGPMGPKTLCNACGVRYKSGRLFPEYRPAASPTFVPTIHSNSHKKVVEMRTKGCENYDNPIIVEPTTPPLELIPTSNPLLD